MNKFRIIIPLLITACLIPASLFGAAFNTGEKLEYSLSWNGIPAGTTVMEVRETSEINGKDAIHLSSRTWANSFVSLFTKVGNDVDCYIDPDNFASLLCDITSKSSKRTKYEKAIFDYDKNEVEYTETKSDKKNKKKTKTVMITSEIRDSFSSIYYLRTLDLKEGEKIEFDTFSGGTIFQNIITPIKKEKVSVDAGSFDTIKVKNVVMEDGKVIDEGENLFWLTDDEEKIPVKIKTKLEVGSLTAKLKTLVKGEVKLEKPLSAYSTPLPAVQDNETVSSPEHINQSPVSD